MTYRHTKQREIILSILRAAKRPMSAGDIHAQAAEYFPTLALTTVYRNLEALTAQHTVTRHRLDDNQYSYELAARAHNHYIVCLACGRVVPFSDCPMEELTRRVADQTGFSVVSHNIELFGYCPGCRLEAGKEDR